MYIGSWVQWMQWGLFVNVHKPPSRCVLEEGQAAGASCAVPICSLSTDTWFHSRCSMCVWFVSNDMYLQWVCAPCFWAWVVRRKSSRANKAAVTVKKKKKNWIVSWQTTQQMADGTSCSDFVYFACCCLYYLLWTGNCFLEKETPLCLVFMFVKIESGVKRFSFPPQ